MEIGKTFNAQLSRGNGWRACGMVSAGLFELNLYL